MSQNQYGPQGDPVRVSHDEPRPPEPGVPVVVGAHDEGVEVQTLGQFVAGEPGEHMTREEFEARGGTPAGPEPTDAERAEHKSALAAEYLRRAEEAEAKVRAAQALVVRWDDRASGTLAKGDYEKGQRLALTDCSDELRAVVGP